MLMSRAKLQFIAGIIGGISISFLVRAGTRKLISSHCIIDNIQNTTYFAELERKSVSSNVALMLVGVQTAEKYLDTRMKAVNETWAQHIYGDVIFFSGVKSSSYRQHPGISVVYLPGVPDNMYPPQKKSFLMLKYMHDHFIDKYDWFVRADDDSFILGPALGKFLSSINSSKVHYIGQGGEGREGEKGQLGLKNNVAYCMGGPGVILSRATLIKLAPHIEYCLQNSITSHEDTELGRCIYKFVGISCTRAAEMRHLFYQNYKQLNGSINPAESKSDIRDALTLHPFKNHTFLFAMQNYIQIHRLKKLQMHYNKIRQEETVMNESLQEIRRVKKQRNDVMMSIRSRETVAVWTAYKGKSINSHKEVVPKHVIHNAELQSIIDVILDIEKSIAENLKKDEQLFYVRHFQYGYNKINPISGSDYIFNLKVCCSESKENDNTAYFWFKRNFSELECSEELPNIIDNQSYEQRHIYSQTKRNENMKARVNFIIPLSGKVTQLQKFIDNLQNSFLRFGEDVSLLVVLFWKKDKEAERDNIETIITDLQLEFPGYWIQLVKKQGDFNRGIALNIGATYFKDNDLLFFVDVDCYVDRAITERIQRNTVRHFQAYFPIMFSLYDPHFVWDKIFNFSNEAGYWRFYSYGQVSVYKSDFIRVSGYDTSIRGWGKEDIDFFQRVLDKNIIAFRAPDPGLVHIYHTIHCGLELPHEQYRMCLGTKWSTYSSVEILAKIAYSTKEITNRNNEE